MSEAELQGIVFDAKGDYSPKAKETARAVLVERGADLTAVARERDAAASAQQRGAQDAVAAQARVVAAVESLADHAARSLPICPGCRSRSATTEVPFSATAIGLAMRDRALGAALPPDIAPLVDRTGRYTVRLTVPMCDSCAPRFAPRRFPRFATWLILSLAGSLAAVFGLLALVHHFEDAIARFVDPGKLRRPGVALALLIGALLAAIPPLRSTRAARRLAALHPFWPTLKPAAFAPAPAGPAAAKVSR
jgi:hypothetical protein